MTEHLRAVGIVFVVLGLVAYALLSALEKRVPAEGDLAQFNGRLARPITAISGWKAETHAEVAVETKAGRIEKGRVPHMCFLWVDCVVPQNVASLKPGDELTVWLSRPERFEGDSRFVWRMEQGGTALLSLRETAAANAAHRARYLHLFGGVSLFGLACIVGAWIIGHVHATPKRP